jgi:hypothetical protein
MRCKPLSHAMLGLIAIGGAITIVTPAARAQMCTPAIKDCESQADAEARHCTMQCTRYDTICTDRCDDTHDIIVRYCWIKQALCKAAEESHGFVNPTSERK